jgi:hypothetical protein
MFKRSLAVSFAVLLAGCGTVSTTTGQHVLNSAPHALADAPIVDLPGLPLGTDLPLVGKYQSFKITGTGRINALDAAHLDVKAHVTAKIGFISQTKDVTFVLNHGADPAWPYQFTAVNVTDNQTYAHKASLTAHTPGSSTFKLDDNSTAVVAADGKGSARIVYGDFDLSIGKSSSAGLIGPAVNNSISREHFFRH